MASIKVEITDGHVLLKEFVDRKTSKAYNATLFKGVNVQGDVTPEIPLNNTNEALDVLVLGLIKEVAIGEKVITSDSLDQSVIDDLRSEDFNKIADKAREINEGDKKKPVKLKK